MVMIHEEYKKTIISNKRLIVVLLVQIFMLFILVARLFYLQIINYEKYNNLSDNNRFKTFMLPALRGHIYDRNNIRLTENKKKYRVLFYENQNKNKEITIKNLVNILNLPNSEYDRMITNINKNRNQLSISLIDDIIWDDLVKISMNSYKLEGIVVEDGYIRYYPYPTTFSHIIGYVNNPTQDEIKKESNIKKREILLHHDYKIGRTGLERLLNTYITGKVGFRKMEMNARSVPVREVSVEQSKEGKDVKLTIDFNLQKFVEDKMKNIDGSIIVMNVNTGEILSMVSTPTYDTNQFVEGVSYSYWNEINKNPSKPLNNKAVSATYPPGSTFKLITAIAGLENGWKPTERVYCSGKVDLDEIRKLHCWNRYGHGYLSLVNAIRDSCNIYFTKIGLFAGIDNIYKTALDFGLGEEYELNIMNKKKGTVPNREWKKNVFKEPWFIGDTVNVSIGQGFINLTPLELVVMTSRIANGGYKIKPYLLFNSPIADENKKILRGSPIVKETTIDLIKQGMYKVVNDKYATAYNARIYDNQYKMAGKTGTAQVISKATRKTMKKTDKRYQNHGLFVGFAPYNNPKYAIVVVVEHGGSGSLSAAPLARDVLLYAQKNNIGFAKEEMNYNNNDENTKNIKEIKEDINNKTSSKKQKEILKDDVNIIQNNKNTYNEILQTDKNKQSNKENINDFSNVIEEIVNKQNINNNINNTNQISNIQNEDISLLDKKE